MSKSKQLPPELIEQFTTIVGEKYALADEAEKAPYLQENRGIFESASPLILRPGSTEEVAEILQLASRSGTGIVPQGGNTGHVGGSVANPERAELIVSLSRLNKMREIDASGFTMVVEAGMILENIQNIAASHDRLFPLSLGAQGSCQIGGNIATNAGGTGVLAYGNTRDMVLGLEVVLPSGEIWHGLRKLRKDNTGYDLRDLFIGAEGTLGIITAAVLRLFPMPKGREVAFVGLGSPQKALELFNQVQGSVAADLTGFELMPRIGIEFVTRHIPATRDPLPDAYPWYVLIEISSAHSPDRARNMIEQVLAVALQTDLADDAVLALSLAQQKQFWHLREAMSEAQRPEGGSIKHDISVAIADVSRFLEAAEKIVRRIASNGRIVAFGHLGDGNIHYNISQPENGDRLEFMAKRQAMNDAIHQLVDEFGGSISAEHGIGLMKKQVMARLKQPVELELMRQIKKAFDPANIMNPGKVL